MINITETSQITKIYLVTNCFGDPNKVYIGKERSGKKRKREQDHKHTFGKKSTFDYIDECNCWDSKIWVPLEKFWIEYFRQLGFDLQNKNKGGGGTTIVSEETKNKIRSKLIGSKRSRETKSKMSLSQKGIKKHSKESRDKISKGKKDHPCFNNEWRKKIGDSNRKPKPKDFYKIKSIPILLYDLEDNFIEELQSISYFLLKYNIKSRRVIMKCLNGEKEQYKNFKIKYKT